MLGFKSRVGISRLAEDILKKAKTESERKSRCLYIAQLFYDVQEYEEVINYANEYISLKINSSAAYKLIGQAYEALNQFENAIQAFEKCFQIEDSQHELLIKLSELYCEPNVSFDRNKAKKVLHLIEKHFPHHSSVNKLRERIDDDSSSLGKDEYEKLLAAEIKKNPEDCKYRVKLMELYIGSGRTELAYRSCSEIENNKMFSDRIEWYECLDKVYQAYYKTCCAHCPSEFFVSRLHCVDRLCALSYSPESCLNAMEFINPIIKMDKLLLDVYRKFNTDEYKCAVQHYSAQLSFHLAMIICLKTKVKADFLTESQYKQIWFENKCKVGALLLFAIKNCVFTKPKEKFNGYELRYNQGKARYVQVYYTFQSLARLNNQGVKQLFDCICYSTAENWREEIFKLVQGKPGVDNTKSYFMNSDFFEGVPSKEPNGMQMRELLISYDIVYGKNLHNMIWIGLATLENSLDIFSLKIHPNLRLSAFSSFNVNCGKLTSFVPESISQLDMDSFLYLVVISKALQNKFKGDRQQVILPSCITSKLYTDKELQFWNSALLMALHLGKEKDSSKSSDFMKGAEMSENERVVIQSVLEQVRAHSLPLPLTVILARTFTSRIDLESPVVSHACEKRALHLWDSVMLKIKLSNKKMPAKISNTFFNFETPSYSNSELKSIGDEAKFFIGSYYFKNSLHDKALALLEQVKSSESLYKQALIYEDLSLKQSEQFINGCDHDVRAVQTLNSDKCYDLLIKSLEMIESDGESNSCLAKEIREKLGTLPRFSGDNNISAQPSINCDDPDDLVSPHYIVNQIQDRSEVITSTPQRAREHRTYDSSMTKESITVGSHDLGELLTSYKNQFKLQGLENSQKLLSERMENLQCIVINRLDGMAERISRRFDKMELSLKNYFTDLKKEIKQKPDLYNMLEEDDYSPDAEVLNYPNYYQNAVQRSSAAGLIQGAAYAGTAGAPTLPPPAAGYFPPNQLYQGSVPFYGQTVPFPTEPQMADYLRTLANQRGNALGSLPTVATIHQAPLVPGALAQVPTAPSPSGAKQQVQPQAPNNVVITTSDSLPTSVPTTAPTLFVNIPPEHRLGSTPVTAAQPVSTSVVMVPVTAAPHKFQIPMPSNFKRVEKAPVDDPAEDAELEATLEVSKDSDGGAHLEHDPLPNFKPVIPLPDEVEIRTGEENETVVFDCRAKLFRLADKEWKERGLGQLKILKSHDEFPRYRILMRREQVHKVCANHFINADMKLVKATGNDKSYIWWAHDFADEKVEVEKLLVRFKTVEDGELFRSKFEEGSKAAEKILAVSPDKSKNVLKPPKLCVDNANLPGKDNTITMGGFTFTSQPKIVEVNESEKKPLIEEKKVASPFASFNFGSSSTDSKGSQPMSFGFATKGANIPQTKKEQVKSEGSSKLLELLKPEPGSWECSCCYTRNVAGSKMCVACQAPIPSSAANADDKTQKVAPFEPNKKDSTLPSLASMFKPPPGSQTCQECLVQNKPDASSCVACGTVMPGSTSSQTFIDNTTTFTFGIPPTATVTTPSSNPVQTVFGQATADVTKPQPASAASNLGSGIFTFGMPGAQTSADFSFGSAKFNFTMATPNKSDDPKGPLSSPRSAHKSDADDTDNEQHEEDHDHTEGIYFQPVIEMPDKIEVKTGEEDEAVMYSQRSKLFRFDSDSKEWKERGVGDVKILKHKSSGRIRLLMRREPVMKLCLNHYLTPELEMKSKDPKSWIWCAPDFSEGEQVLEKFCIRFKTPDISQEFKKNVDAAKTGKVSSDEADSSDDVIFVSETKIVSDKLRNKALALKLPENFYKYLTLPDCPGCRGCEKDTVGEVIKISMPKRLEDKSFPSQPLYFGISKAPLNSGVSVLPKSSDDILNGKTIFGNSLIKPVIISTDSKTETDKNNSFSFTPPTSNVTTSAEEKSESQISSFSFTVAQSKTSTPVFSFSSQNPIFGSPLNTFGSGSGNNQSFGANPSLETKPEIALSANPVFGSKSVEPSPTQPGGTPVFGSGADPQTPKSIFSLEDNQKSPKTEPSTLSKPIFGSVNCSSTTSDNQEAKDNDMPAFLTKHEGLYFSTLASKANSANVFAGDNSNFKWEGVGTKLFASKTEESKKPNKEEEAEDDDTLKHESEDNEEHDPYFEPVIPLPDKVELKTGEEDEDAVFSERAKLYRIDQDTKEWKERGVGIMKVLKHRQRGSYRLLMRREQVHKIVCNHLITQDLKLCPHSSSDSIFCWGAMNMSQDDTEPSQELLCAKFKTKELAVQFKDAFEAATKISSSEQ